MVNSNKGLAGADVDTEFYFKLSAQRGVQRFSRLELTPRKLPQPPLVQMISPARDQHPAVLTGDDGYRNLYRRTFAQGLPCSCSRAGFKSDTLR